jgi:flavin reductase (DIM6/NTAB) family NADH-FMN oxidoreductase RutF
MVRGNKKVVLTIPGAAIKDAVMGCGMSTGRDTNKAEKLGIEMQSIPGSDIQIPTHTRVAIHCTLKEYHEVGDHYLYICNVDQVFADENEEALFAWNGYARIATAKQGE